MVYGHDGKIRRVSFRSDLIEHKKINWIYHKEGGENIKVLVWDLCKGNSHNVMIGDK